jgi:hypothetical protein
LIEGPKPVKSGTLEDQGPTKMGRVIVFTLDKTRPVSKDSQKTRDVWGISVSLRIGNKDLTIMAYGHRDLVHMFFIYLSIGRSFLLAGRF